MKLSRRVNQNVRIKSVDHWRQKCGIVMINEVEHIVMFEETELTKNFSEIIKLICKEHDIKLVQGTYKVQILDELDQWLEDIYMAFDQKIVDKFDWKLGRSNAEDIYKIILSIRMKNSFVQHCGDKYEYLKIDHQWFNNDVSQKGQEWNFDKLMNLIRLGDDQSGNLEDLMRILLRRCKSVELTKDVIAKLAHGFEYIFNKYGVYRWQSIEKQGNKQIVKKHEVKVQKAKYNIMYLKHEWELWSQVYSQLWWKCQIKDYLRDIQEGGVIYAYQVLKMQLEDNRKLSDINRQWLSGRKMRFKNQHKDVEIVYNVNIKRGDLKVDQLKDLELKFIKTYAVYLTNNIDIEIEFFKESIRKAVSYFDEEIKKDELNKFLDGINNTNVRLNEEFLKQYRNDVEAGIRMKKFEVERIVRTEFNELRDFIFMRDKVFCNIWHICQQDKINDFDLKQNFKQVVKTEAERRIRIDLNKDIINEMLLMFQRFAKLYSNKAYYDKIKMVDTYFGKIEGEVLSRTYKLLRSNDVDLIIDTYMRGFKGKFDNEKKHELKHFIKLCNKVFFDKVKAVDVYMLNNISIMVSKADINVLRDCFWNEEIKYMSRQRKVGLDKQGIG